MHLLKVIQLILGASRRVLATSPASPLAQQGKARASPTCWLAFNCCSWRTRLVIWTDLAGYLWSMYVLRKFTSSRIFLILAFSCSSCRSRSGEARRDRRQDPRSKQPLPPGDQGGKALRGQWTRVWAEASSCKLGEGEKLSP